MNGTDASGSAAPAAAARRPLDERTARELLQITRQMVTAAHADDWDAVALHDTSRRELLANSPERTPGEKLPDSLTEALIAADQAVLKQARRVRDAVRRRHAPRAHRT